MSDETTPRMKQPVTIEDAKRLADEIGQSSLAQAPSSADLDRRVRLGITAAREAEMEQLVNDLAENMNLRRWKRADLLACIAWQQWLMCDAATDRAALRMKMLKVLTDDMLPNDKVSSGDYPK